MRNAIQLQAKPTQVGTLAAVDGHGRPLAAVVAGGHRNDGALLDAVLADIPRLGAGRPRTRPDVVLAGKAYSARVYRRALHARGIRVVIPEKSDQIAEGKRRGSRGGRPPGLDVAAYRGRNVVERQRQRKVHQHLDRVMGR